MAGGECRGGSRTGAESTGPLGSWIGGGTPCGFCGVGGNGVGGTGSGGWGSVGGTDISMVACLGASVMPRTRCVRHQPDCAQARAEGSKSYRKRCLRTLLPGPSAPFESSV
jgi:hypothetical protein